MNEKISVILPCRNEALNISRMVHALFSTYPKEIHEIIIVDDCSTDETQNILKKLKNKWKYLRSITRTSNPGVGNALRDGIEASDKKSTHILCMDCDFLINVPDIRHMIALLDRYDGVIGSRFIDPDSLKNYPVPKYIANRSYHLLASLLLGIRNNDLTNNFKLYKKDVVDNVLPLLTRPDFAVNAELGFYPVMMGYSIGAVPVRWWERTKTMGFSKFKILKVGPSYFLVFLKLLKMKYTPK